MVLWPFFSPPRLDRTISSKSRGEKEKKKKTIPLCVKITFEVWPPSHALPFASLRFRLLLPLLILMVKNRYTHSSRTVKERRKERPNKQQSLSLFFNTYNRFYSLFFFVLGFLIFNSSRSCPSVSQSGADVPLCQTEDCSVSSSCHQPFLFVISKEKSKPEMA